MNRARARRDWPWTKGRITSPSIQQLVPFALHAKIDELHGSARLRSEICVLIPLIITNSRRIRHRANRPER